MATLDAAGLSGLAAENRRIRLQAECLELDLAAHWADLNAPTSQRVDPPRAPRLSELPIVERSTRPGGAGTPEVLEFAAAELGAVLGMTMTAATSLMADALDLRHRLPRVWELVHAGQVRQWQARQVAHASRLLSLEGARALDAAGRLDGDAVLVAVPCLAGGEDHRG